MVFFKFISLITFLMYNKVLSQVFITSPESLRKKFESTNGEIAASFSDFGKIPYGFTTSGKVYLDPENTETDYACRPLTNMKIDLVQSSSYDSAIILVDRGNCTFVKKVKNVEDKGGQIALIVNNVEGDPNDIMMMDDGYGKNLTIPGVLISKSDGDIIKKHFIANKNNMREREIRLAIKFKIAKSQGKSHINLYLQSDSVEVYALINEFMQFEKELGESITIKPHYVTFPYSYYETGPVDSCYYSGRYCADPNESLKIKDGRSIIEEDLRQICVFKHAKENKNTHLYVKFMSTFFLECLNPLQPRFTEECHNSVLEIVGIDKNSINTCVQNSFVKTNGQVDRYTIENTLLKAEFDDKKSSELALFPAITVNGQIFLGSWNPKNVLEMVCASFKVENVPKACFKENVFVTVTSEQHITFGIVLLIAVLLVLINVIIYLLCKRYVIRQINDKVDSNELNDQISTVVSRYMAMRETKL